MKPAGIKNLFIESCVRSEALCRGIEERLAVPVEYVDTPDEVYERLQTAPDPVTAGKETLFLCRNKGAFIRPCPGTRRYTCCGYTILHIGSFCIMDCSYCILQSYYHPPLLTYYVNQKEMMSTLDRLLSESPIRRIGTGEFTDSLIWEPIDTVSRRLVLRFAAQDRAVLELKTKTVNIDHLLDLPHRHRTIMAWSLNTEQVIASEERGTTSLAARLGAARRCMEKGYPLAFHFDPLVIYPGCEREYKAVMDRLFEAIAPSSVVWISLGSFRYIPDLKPVVEKRHPASKLVCGEFIRGLDGKMRYYKPLRMGLYRELAAHLKELAPETTIYFCMEDEEVWLNALGFHPDGQEGLSAMLDEAAIRNCGLSKALIY
jgi:spore photoproduct lyase